MLEKVSQTSMQCVAKKILSIRYSSATCNSEFPHFCYKYISTYIPELMNTILFFFQVSNKQCEFTAEQKMFPWIFISVLINGLYRADGK